MHKIKKIGLADSTENMRYTNEISSLIRNMRFPLACLIVLLHCDLERTDISYLVYVTTLISDGLTRIAVPLFFSISGYLFFFKTTVDYNKKLSKRIRSLVVPYIIWNSISLIVLEVLNLLQHRPFQYSLSEFFMVYFDTSMLDDSAPLQHLLLPQWMPIARQFWYIRDLFVVCLISPIILLFLKKLKNVAIPILIVQWLYYTSETSVCCYSTALLFFSLGSYIALYKPDLNWCKNNSLKLTVLWGGGVVAYVVAKDVLELEYCTYFKLVSVLFGILAFVGLFLQMKKPIFVKYDCMSFWLFAIHPWILMILLKIIDLKTLQLSAPIIIILYLMMGVLVVISGIVSYKILSKLTPKLLLLLSGR